MSEWYCDDCRRWSGTTCCVSCLRINPGDARWMTKREIEAARQKALDGLRRKR